MLINIIGIYCLDTYIKNPANNAQMIFSAGPNAAAPSPLVMEPTTNPRDPAPIAMSIITSVPMTKRSPLGLSPANQYMMQLKTMGGVTIMGISVKYFASM